MFYERMEFTATQLNTGVAVSKNIDIDLLGVSSIRITNNTGADISFIVLNEKEKISYDLRTTVTDLIPVGNADTETLYDLSPETSVVVVKGSGSGHTESLYVEIIKDINE